MDYEFEEALELELDKLPYTKHLDDGQYNDGKITGFELGARWCLEYMKANKIQDQVAWQTCPKCNGQGTVTKPPWVPGDVTQWDSTACSFPCDVCNGTKVIPMINKANFT
jgi:hypothetical protein